MLRKCKILLVLGVCFYSFAAQAMDERYAIKFEDPEKQALYEKAFESFDNALMDIASENVMDAGYLIGMLIDCYFIDPEQTFQKMIENQINHVKNEVPEKDVPEACRGFKEAHQRIVCYQKQLEDYTEKYIFEGYPILAGGTEFFPRYGMPEYKYYNLKPRVRKDFATAFDDAHELFKNLSDEKEDIEILTEITYLKVLKFFEDILEYTGEESLERSIRLIQTKSPDYVD